MCSEVGSGNFITVVYSILNQPWKKCVQNYGDFVEKQLIIPKDA
jgi:hypothetical protein